MKDITGREICVGDKIAYASAWGSAKLTVGRVVSLTKKGGDDAVVVERHYGPRIVNGMTKKWIWDEKTKKGTHVPVKPRNTTISYSSRCVVITL